MAKMWAGRTSGETSKIADDFNSSIRFDCKMYEQDIKGSIAHALMLSKQNIITAKDAEILVEALGQILDDLNSGALEIDMEAEDIHMFVEQVLTTRVGDVGKKLHTARSRNDQVALDLRMYLRDECDEIVELTKKLIEALCAQAEQVLMSTGAVAPMYFYTNPYMLDSSVQDVIMLSTGDVIWTYADVVAE